MINCPVCGVWAPEEPHNFDPPDGARCRREHDIFEGCPYEPLKAKARGPWVLDVFTPLPPEEAEAMYQALGPKWDRDRYEREMAETPEASMAECQHERVAIITSTEMSEPRADCLVCGAIGVAIPQPIPPAVRAELEAIFAILDYAEAAPDPTGKCVDARRRLRRLLEQTP